METDYYNQPYEQDALAAETSQELEVANQGLMARIGNRLNDGYNHLKRNVKTYAAIGATAFVGSQAAELAISAEPVTAEGNVPTLALGSAVESASDVAATSQSVVAGNDMPGLTGAALEKACKKEILQEPEVTDAIIEKPGKENQTAFAHVSWDSISKACSRLYRRVFADRFELQDYKHRKKWWSLSGRGWDHLGGSDQAGDTAMSLTNPWHKKVLYYKPGSGAGARLKLRLQDKDKQTGEILGAKTWKYPLEIQGQGRNKHHN